LPFFPERKPTVIAAPMHTSDLHFEPRRLELEREFGEPVTVDGLTPHLRIFQRKHGHRHSTDDVLTAWYALQHGASNGDFLDLGTGIGTVGLLVLSQLPEAARMTCVEAQAVSFRLLTDNIRANQLESRVRAHFGDLRDLALTDRFALVTGSPPYFDVRSGVVPADSQKAHARFELRGDIRDYARAALRHLLPQGTFVFCFPTPQKKRAMQAVVDAGFRVVAHQDVIPRAGLLPLFSLFACRREDDCSGPSVVGPVRGSSAASADPNVAARPVGEEPPLIVREADGTMTAAMMSVRKRFGWPISLRDAAGEGS